MFRVGNAVFIVQAIDFEVEKAIRATLHINGPKIDIIEPRLTPSKHSSKDGF